MKSIFLVCAVCLHLGKSYGSEDTDGVGAFAYDGPSGRYGGTYGLKNGQVVNQRGNFPPNFSPPSFPDLDNFLPDYFNNFDNLVSSPFIAPSSFIRFSPFRRTIVKPFSKRFPFGGRFPGLQGFQGQGFTGPDMSNFLRSQNSAFAGAAIGPDFMQQVAEISPPNPDNPNINKLSNTGAQPGGNFHSVSTSSFVSSSSDSTGRKQETRRAETTINNNGVVTKYKVEN